MCVLALAGPASAAGAGAVSFTQSDPRIHAVNRAWSSAAVSSD